MRLEKASPKFEMGLAQLILSFFIKKTKIEQKEVKIGYASYTRGNKKWVLKMFFKDIRDHNPG